MANDTFEGSMDDDSQKRIEEMLTKLPIEYSSVVRLTLFNRLSFAEIGQRLGLSPAAVKVRLYRARHRLRNL